jgi:predicted esterase
VREAIQRCFIMLAVLLATSAAFAAPGLKPGALNEFSVEMPMELRKLAGRGEVSPVTHALVAIAAPANIDMAREWPVLVVSATSDPQFHSSRKLMSAYTETALAAGWIVVAADPAEEVAAEQDDVPLRLALVKAALAALALKWPGSDTAPLAFGGFSGGAKYSGWLAAAFASEGRRIIGIYLAGINEDTLVAAAGQFHVLDAKFRSVPIFLQSGETDAVSTPADHREVYAELKRAGFRRVRLEYFPGAHEVDPGPLRAALDGFRATSTQDSSSP